MKYYLIGGLGADERVFKHINIDAPTQSIRWEVPLRNESLKAYIQRLSAQIDTSEEFAIVGVSFGGIVAVELNKIICPKQTILISSAMTSKQLPRAYVALGKTGILNLIPNFLIKPPQFVMYFMFGAVNKKMLGEIIRDTDPKFIKWALKTIIKWRSDFKPLNCIRIHGTRDKLIPLKGEAILVKDGQHFMIVDRAAEVSTIINNQIANYK